MEIEASARIRFPRELVFRTYRDRLPELLPYLPNVRGIQVVSRADEDGGAVTRLHNLWRARGEIPRPAQIVLKPDMLAWDDHAVWDERAFTTGWRIQTHAFRDHVRCSGTNTYTEEGGATVLRIRGQLDVKLERVPGVPAFLSRTIATLVEQAIVAMIRPNLLAVADGVGKLLAAEAP